MSEGKIRRLSAAVLSSGHDLEHTTGHQALEARREDVLRDPEVALELPEPAAAVEGVPHDELRPPTVAGRPPTVLLAAAAGTAVSTVYLAHPLLVGIGETADLEPSTVGILVTLQFLLLAAGLLTIGTAGTTPLLLLGFATTGLLAVVAQSLVAGAAALAEPNDRGRVVGGVTSGIVVGILLARTVSGALADLAGWRAVYLTAAAVAVAFAAILYLRFPAVPVLAATRPSYGALLRSTVALLRDQPLLRVRGLLALLIFAAFSTLWSALALPLSDLSHTAVGAFGLAGVAGALAAGRTARRSRPRRPHDRDRTGPARDLLAATRTHHLVAVGAGPRRGAGRPGRAGRARHQPEPDPRGGTPRGKEYLSYQSTNTQHLSQITKVPVQLVRRQDGGRIKMSARSGPDVVAVVRAVTVTTGWRFNEVVPAVYASTKIWASFPFSHCKPSRCPARW